MEDNDNLNLNDDAKRLVEDVAAAINRAVEQSGEVATSINSLREAGFEMELTLRLEIGLRELETEPAEADPLDNFNLTDEDRRTLRRMKIRFDDDDDNAIH